MNKSLEYGRTDVEWWILAMTIAAIWLGFFCSADEESARALLICVRTCTFGVTAYAGFWIAGRAEHKKYINPFMDTIGGGVLMGGGGLVGVAMSLSNHLPDGWSHQGEISPPIILLGAWWLIAIVCVLSRQATAQQENNEG